jgi:hypothetical protein
MAEHRARSRRAFATSISAIAVGAAVTALVGAGQAGALTPDKVARAQNGDVIGKCTLRIQAVNPTDATTNIRLSAQAQPKTVFGYGTNAYTQVFCSVYNPTGTQVLASYNPFANAATVQSSSITPAVPRYSTYLVCARAFVKLNNGDSSVTPLVCA